MSEALEVRVMTEADIPVGMRLKRQAKWNQTEADWKRFLRLNPQGCFVGCLGGQPVATVTTTVFGRVGWIAMVLVDLDQRGRGFGKQMLRCAIDHLEPAVETIKLDATEMGRPLYEKLGFQTEYSLTRYECHPDRNAKAGAKAEAAVLPDELLRLDAAVYGADRSRLLRRLAEEGNRLMVVRNGGLITGYGMMRPGENALHVGPAVAENLAAYEEIVDWVRQRAERVCFLDVPDVSVFHRRIRNDLGLVRQRDFRRMYRGKEPFGGEPSAVVATSGAEKG